MEDILKEIQEEVKKLNSKFDSKIKYDTSKELIIDKLHNELQIYKDDLYKKMLLPLVNNIIQFIDRGEREAFSIVGKNLPQEELIERFLNFFEDLRDILYIQGIEPYKTDGNNFDPKKQKILKKIITHDIQKDKKIAAHRTWGYSWDNKIIKHEGVDIYLYKKLEKENNKANINEDNIVMSISNENNQNSDKIPSNNDTFLEEDIFSSEEKESEHEEVTLLSSPKKKN